MLGKVRELVKGKRTYLSALGLIAAALISFSDGGSLTNLITKILEACAIMGLRAGIAPLLDSIKKLSGSVK